MVLEMIETHPASVWNLFLQRKHKLLCLAFLAMLLSGCGPYYKTFTTYLPPQNDQGRHCALNCENQRLICQNDCDDTYQSCVREAQLEAKADYLDAKEDYLDRKEHCVRRAHREDGKEDRRCRHLSEPSLFSYVHDSHCRSECGCQETFDRCFEICGGRVVRETRCVSNCN